MKNQINRSDLFVFVSIVTLAVVAIAGTLSFNTENSYFVANQYGHQVQMYGSGIYASDSYFRAPIFIGSDLTMLVIALPLLVGALLQNIKKRTIKTKLFLVSILSVVLYYAVSISFGVTYNVFQLLYIALFSSAIFGLFTTIRSIDFGQLQKAQTWELPSKGISVFLVLSGLALFIAWLPDIIPTIISGTTLPLIEVYTTEITYVLDMGVISPMIFLCLYLLKKKDGLGQVLLAITLTLCVIMGIMLPVQTAFQLWAEIEIPAPVLVTKVGIFVLLAIFALYFNQKMFRNIKE